jgi:ACS family glucarate transporter-like MFS transporter
VRRPPGIRSAVRWKILALLFAASFVAYVLRTNMSIAGEAMSADLGLSQLQLGMILAAFAWGYAALQFPGGLLGEVLGGRRALALMAVLWGVLNLLVGVIPVVSVTTGLVTLIALRGLMGVAQAPLYPVTSGGTISNWFPVGGWALPNGLTNAGLTLGSAATGPLIVWLTDHLGWRQSFILTAPAGFLVAALWWWYSRDQPADHPAVSPAELALIQADRPPPSSAGSTARGLWKLVLRDRQVMLLTASYFCSNYLFYFFFNWLFIYLVQNRGFRSLEGGYYAAAPWIAGAVGAVVGGIVCDRLTRHIGIRLACRWPALVSLVLAAGLISAAAMAHDPLLAVLLLSACLACQQATEGAFWAATISVSGEHASAACGVLNTGGNVVGGLGALLVPITVRTLGWGPALATASGFALLGGILWLGIRADWRMVENHSRQSQPASPGIPRAGAPIP